MIEEDEEAGTKDEQAEFTKELEAFYKGRYMDFKPPKFYGEPLNCLKYVPFLSMFASYSSCLDLFYFLFPKLLLIRSVEYVS